MIVRLMTGFESSILSGVWAPSGTPAIAKLIEELDSGPDQLKVIFTRGWTGADEHILQSLRGRTVTLSGLQTSIDVLAEGLRIPAKLAPYTREFVHFCRVLTAIRRFKPDLIYVDRSNILIAGILARISRIPVVLRLLGVPPSLMGLPDLKGPAARLLRWSFRGPFSQVICSQDGSGGGDWMRRTLASEVPRCVWLNGVDKLPIAQTTNAVVQRMTQHRAQGKLVVALVGRIEALKGAGFFIDALLGLPDAYHDRIQGVVVGEGTLRVALEQKVSEYGAGDRIVFTGTIAHRDVGAVLATTDAAVSLNLQGHLSNVNLEAMRAGTCLIVRSNTPDGGLGEDFDALVPSDARLTIGQDAGPAELAEVLCRLSDDPDLLATRRARMHSIAQVALVPWSERIGRERDLLSSIASAGMNE